MVDLALEYGKGPVSVSTLAAQQGISEAYLEQLAGALKKAEFIDSVRGAAGGYFLSKRPADISVGEVLRALEGSTDIIDCVGSVNAECDNACSCSARPLWLKLQSKIDGVLNETSLADMADDYKKQIGRTKDAKSIS
jgi:Rrf2 family protein